MFESYRTQNHQNRHSAHRKSPASRMHSAALSSSPDGFRSGDPVHHGSANPETGGFLRSFRAAVWSLPVTVLLGLFFLTVAVFLAYADDDPATLSVPLALTALSLTALTGGFICARRAGTAPVLSGCLGGLLLSFLLFLLSFTVNQTISDPASPGFPAFIRLGLHASVVFLEMLGGYIGGRRNRRRTKPRHASGNHPSDSRRPRR